MDEVGKKFPALGNCQILVLRESNQDRMIFRAELLSRDVDAEQLRLEVAKMVQEIIRLKGEVVLVGQGEIPPEAKKIEDQRKWD